MDYGLCFDPESFHYFRVEFVFAYFWLIGSASSVNDNHIALHHAKIEQGVVAEYVPPGMCCEHGTDGSSNTNVASMRIFFQYLIQRLCLIDYPRVPCFETWSLRVFYLALA